MKTTYFDAETRGIVNVSQNLGDGLWEVNRVRVPTQHEGRGVGRRLMEEMLRDADDEGVELWLDINPYGALDYSQLEAWYMRLGFQRCDGRYRRQPQVLPA